MHALNFDSKLLVITQISGIVIKGLNCSAMCDCTWLRMTWQKLGRLRYHKRQQSVTSPKQFKCLLPIQGHRIETIACHHVIDNDSLTDYCPSLHAHDVSVYIQIFSSTI